MEIKWKGKERRRAEMMRNGVEKNGVEVNRL
jgi:hypothetical protein